MPSTKFALTTLCTLILLSLVGRTKGEFNHSIGPLAHCSSQMIDARQYTEACYRRCKRDAKPEVHGFVYLYSDTSSTGGPIVTSCSKQRLSQTFTETWTFSQITSSPVITPLLISKEDCEQHIQMNCPTHNCSTKLPNSLSPEFHYASDTVVTRDFIVLISMPSGVDFLEETIKVTPAMTDVSFPLSDGYGSIGTKWFFWSPQEAPTVCPFAQSQYHGCDAYGKPIDLINCRRSRFVIPDVGHSIQLKGHCSHISRSSTGLLYSWQDKMSLTSDAAKRLALTQLQNENEQIAMLRMDTTNALNVLDEDICFTQCELLDVILRSDRNKEVLTRIGGSYLLVTKTGYIRKCGPLLGCQLITPHTFCGNPNRVGVTCHGKVHLWNPMKGYTEDGGECNHHFSGTKFSVSVGNHLYHVDDSLHIELPESEYFGLSHDPMASSEDKISKTIVDPSELRRSWENYKTLEQGMTPVFTNENKTINNWGEGVNLDFNLGSIGRVIRDITGRVTWWITLFLTLVCAVIGYKIWCFLFKKQQNETHTSVIYTPVQSSATWM
ncbi:glycoprotein [Strawberry virus 2]|nr:glycoprotein [Strawberry virus 2]